MKINKTKYLDEVLYSTKLENGLSIYIIKKIGFHEKAAYLGVNFGSLNTGDYIVDEKGVKHKMLGGIAHFLEHRLFDNVKGNVLDLYDQLGASTNAYTSHNKTVYYFSTLDNFNKALNLLLDFTHELNISELSVEKEKEIIIEELKMYLDMPSRNLFYSTLEAMYHKHPYKYDIGGEIKEVQQTTKDMLKMAHETFYDPRNMSLVIVGDVDVDETINLIKENQKDKVTTKYSFLKNVFEEPKEVVKEKLVVQSYNQTPEVMLGYKLPTLDHLSLEEKVKVDLAFVIYDLILFSPSGYFYEKLLEEKLINSVSAYNVIFEQLNTFIINAHSNNPEQLITRLKQIISESEQYITKENVEKRKKELISDLIYGYNSCSRIGYNFINFILDGFNYFEYEKMIKEIDVTLVLDVIQQYLLKGEITEVVMINGKN